VNRISRAYYRDFAEHRKDHDLRRDIFEREAVLPMRSALILMVLLSLALWWIIWKAASALAPALFG
jgi:hypothetical protein